MVSRSEYRRALSNVARNAGVSIEEVETSYRESLKKSAASVASLFLANSVITLPTKKTFRCVRSAVTSVRRGKVSQFDKEMTK